MMMVLTVTILKAVNFIHASDCGQPPSTDGGTSMLTGTALLSTSRVTHVIEGLQQIQQWSPTNPPSCSKHIYSNKEDQSNCCFLSVVANFCVTLNGPLNGMVDLPSRMVGSVATYSCMW